ncbi:DUF742 domain-containing protein [Micromonospora carbonacea]|uniref:DUF742 domain-containing protein n=1 Tax=Micromonospora carbonacea TaxID=47853 RepID=UPI003D9DBB5A
MSPEVAGTGPDPEPVVRIRPYLRAQSPDDDGTGGSGGFPGGPGHPGGPGGAPGPTDGASGFPGGGPGFPGPDFPGGGLPAGGPGLPSSRLGFPGGGTGWPEGGPGLPGGGFPEGGTGFPGGPGDGPPGSPAHDLPGRSGAPDPHLPTGPRPFVLTSGRVAGVDPAISLETQVTARPGPGVRGAGPVSRLAPELQAIIALCGEPISVAEISARARLHFGVTRILVGDLRAAGHLDVHVNTANDALDPDIILRVIDGLRAIS